nr:hypothetical protein [Prevotella sp.]
MKNILRFSYMVLLSLVAFAISSCTSDYDYTGAPKVANEVYFSNTQQSKIELSKSNSSFVVTLHRVETKGELTVLLNYTPDEGSIFSVPNHVTFADGEAEAPITITYNPEDLQYGTYNGGTISVANEDYDTTYGIGSFTFEAGATEWMDINTNKSTGAFRDDAISSLLGIEPPTFEVKIQKSVVEEGKYRILNPYKAWADEYAEKNEATYDGADHYWVINATDPDYVYFEPCETGVDLGLGAVTATSFVANYLSQGVTLDKIKVAKPELFGKLEKGVITMPAKSLLILMGDKGYYGGTNGLFSVALPGNVIADYRVEAAYKGRFTDANDNDFALVTMTLSNDVAKVKYALVPASSDLNATVSGIIDGSVASEEVSASGDVQVPFDETGKYVLVMVMYNANDEAVGSDVLNLSLKSSKDAAEVWNDVAAGTVTIGVKSYGSILFQKDPGVLMGEPVVTEGVLSQSGSDPTKFRITPFADDKTPLEFTVAEDGSITVETQETGLALQDGTAILVTDIVTYLGADSDTGKLFASKGFISKYDNSKKFYTFFNIYTDASDNAFAFESDTFEVTDEGNAKIHAAFAKAKKAAAHHSAVVSAKAHKMYVAKRGAWAK